MGSTAAFTVAVAMMMCWCGVASGMAAPYYSGFVSEGHKRQSYTLPELPYLLNDLEPLISGEVVRVHYRNHFRGYVDKTNAALGKWAELHHHPKTGGAPIDDKYRLHASKGIAEMLMDLDTVHPDVRTAVRNNGGGLVNHALYFAILNKPDTAPNAHGRLAKDITSTFGSMAELRKKTLQLAGTVFGSGYVFMYREKGTGDLKLATYANQDTPLHDGHIPVLCIDVWEHAYYLQYKSSRAAYLDSFWRLLDFNMISQIDDFALHRLGFPTRDTNEL